ncbi:hypothetical protein [Streptomyces sp. TLI_053]|uniref:hypothetical protein n=1 Tax=Streptomyces sp. TLI_053 TaxID=1855352 RepID=UPI000B84CEEB|nr:hypothetical protein [Streptomyces sp. TLI_053]
MHHVAGTGADRRLDHLLGEDRDRADDETVTAVHDALHARYWPVVRPLPAAADLLRARAGRGWGGPGQSWPAIANSPRCEPYRVPTR